MESPILPTSPDPAPTEPASKPPDIVPPKLILKPYSEFTPRAIDWLWPGRLPLGKLVVLSGNPGVGKTTLLVDFAARVSTGRSWPDGAQCPLGSVLLWTAEDGVDDTLLPRLLASGGDPDKVIDVGGIQSADGTAEPFRLDTDVPALRDAIEQVGDVRLVILDPVSAAYGGSVRENNNADIRRVLGPLCNAADDAGCCVIGNSHFGKNADRAGVHRTLGSVALVAAARMAWAVTSDADDPELFKLLPQKSNLARTRGMEYRIEEVDVDGISSTRIAWNAEPIDDRLDDYRETPEAESEVDKAVEWIKTRLADGVRVPSSEFSHDADSSGIKRRTLTRARSRAGVRKAKDGHGGWFVYLDDPQDCQPY